MAQDIQVDNYGLNLFIFIFIRQKRQHSMKRRFYYLNCKKFGQLTIRKILEIVATRC